MKEEFLIKSEEDLRAVISDPKPVTEKKVVPFIDEQCGAFIKQSPFICLATTDKENRVDVSPKGDAPGFVEVLDEKTLLIPERPGNKLAFGFRNILETGQVGVIFIIPDVLETLRINGTAKLSRDPELLERLSAKGKPAILCTIVTVDECFLHCGKSMIRSSLWKPETWQGKGDFSFTRQISNSLNIKEEDVQKSIDDAYKNKLY